ncbi:ribonuclease H-like domain-containing protein [Tanacetum coccineum]
MCDKKNSVLFTETKCLILSPSFKLLDESLVVLRAPIKDDVYSLDLKNIVPLWRCDNGTEFKNYAMNELCAKKGIKREFSVARTPHQGWSSSGMCGQLLLCLPDELWLGAQQHRAVTVREAGQIILLAIPFGCSLTILNTLDSLGKFDGKSDEGYLLGYYLTSDAQEKPSENASPDKDIQDSEDVIIKEGQHQMPEDEQVLQDELEMMITSQKNGPNSSYKSTNQLVPLGKFVSTDRSNTPNISAASTPTDANVGESSFVYLGGKIHIDASTLPNADLPIDPNMHDLEDALITLQMTANIHWRLMMMMMGRM